MYILPTHKDFEKEHLFGLTFYCSNIDKIKLNDPIQRKITVNVCNLQELNKQEMI